MSEAPQTAALEDPPALDAHEADLPEQVKVRRGKREAMLAAGVDPYPVTVPVTHTLAEVREQWGHLGTGEETQDEVGVAGRVVFVRNTGKLCFATLQAGDGTRLQAMLSLAEVGQDRAYTLDIRHCPTGHDRQRAGVGAGRATRHRRIHPAHAGTRLQFSGHFAGRRRLQAGEIHQQLPGTRTFDDAA